MTHKHTFDPASWPFERSIRSVVYSTRQLVQDGCPILTVAHDHDGDFQFLCGTPEDVAEISTVCLGCMFEQHPWIAEFADLPKGWVAWRSQPDAPWHKEQLDDVAGDDDAE